MSKVLVAGFYCVLLSACASADRAQLQGHYYWGHEVETFHPCGSNQEFWVTGDDALLQPLRDQAAELSRLNGQPYQPVYIAASGISEGKAFDGFAADYDGVYRLTAVHATKSVMPAGCTAHG
jgi:hypothetical protein